MTLSLISVSTGTASSRAGEYRTRQRELVLSAAEVTIYFWVIKVLCTTVGETAADFLNVNLNMGLTLTSVVMTVLLVISLSVQMRRDRYVPWVYWLAWP
jgi:uncharacterized membrane-anchored protein